ncbi:MAG TPA: hypothetical protein VGE02_04620 [Gemmatimonadales bacterium]
MLELIGLMMTGTAVVGGFAGARRFVRDRLRFVDAAHTPRAPWIAGGLAMLAATPIVAVLPMVGAGTAILFGASVGYGVQKGRKESRGRRGEIMVR